MWLIAKLAEYHICEPALVRAMSLCNFYFIAKSWSELWLFPKSDSLQKKQFILSISQCPENFNYATISSKSIKE